ncbi:LysR substrate-binding domain-containing protein [Glacieibacterium frigidum]|uniref:LysR family transcriptional regulator n=1 Tax=Glacieibacterium frigidum TaxID=2593303 RepID=A0A552U8E3_9SPHN|nr:LysR substrate-binding domain-containing protein [Glacieibacterium frigidum]TRW14484.1 LysR family transcriptional regulator [Glacieibacterium frigidum]
MLNLSDAYYFVQVVDQGGFASAARKLDLPKSTLSHRIGELELALGVRLLNRTSRQVALTQTGEEFYRHASDLIANAAKVEEVIRSGLKEPSGVIRVTTTTELSEYVLCDLLPAFLARHPKVRITEEATDRIVDIIAEGFDVAIRGHNSALADSSLIQRHIAKAPWILFAGARYLKDMGAPTEPGELERQTALALSRPGMTVWQLTRPGHETRSVPLTPRFRTNSMVSLKMATCANLGIAALPGYICRREIEDGSLVPVLPDWRVMDASFSVLIPYRLGVPPGVRALLDFLAAELPKALRFDDPARGAGDTP